MNSSAQYDMETARNVVRFMAERSLAPTPKNFRIWTLYLTGTNRELVDAVRLRIASGAPINESFCAALYTKVFGGGDVDPIVTQAEAAASNTLMQVREVLSGAAADQREYAAALNNGEGALIGSAEVRRMRAAVMDLIEATQKMERRSAVLERDLHGTLSRIAALNSELEHLKAETGVDPLSGLANRKRFDDALKHLTGRGHDGRRALSIVMADIDHFKTLNGRWGYQVGDQIIRFVASALAAEAGPRHIVCRYGGKQFTVIILESSVCEASRYAESVRARISAATLTRRSTKEKIGNISISLGVVMRGEGEQPESLVARAGENLLRSKRHGRNRVTF
jgi:diguanylate cyclase